MADESAPSRARSGPGPALVIATSLAGMALAWLLFGQSVDRYASTAEVLVAELASAETSPDSVRAIENEARFARSERLQSVMSANLPGIPIDITIDTDPIADVVRFTAIDPSPRRAQRVAQTWAEFFVSERRQALIDGWLSTRDALERELVTLSQAIADARLAGNDELAETLQARRDRAVDIDASMLGEIGALRSSTGAEIVVPADLPVEPVRSTSGRTALIGLGLGALAGAVWLALRRLVGRQEADAGDHEPARGISQIPERPDDEAPIPQPAVAGAAVETVDAGAAPPIEVSTRDRPESTEAPELMAPPVTAAREPLRPVGPLVAGTIGPGATRTAAAATSDKPRIVALPTPRLSAGLDLPIADTPPEPSDPSTNTSPESDSPIPATPATAGPFGRYVTDDTEPGATEGDEPESPNGGPRIVAFPLPTADVADRRPAASDD